MMNIINGGAHADNDLNIQEFMIRPDSAKNFMDALEKCFLVIQNLKKILTKKIVGPICILVGPEGDFSEAERQSIIELDQVCSLSLANNILRAETAAIAAVTIVNYHLNFS